MQTRLVWMQDNKKYPDRFDLPSRHFNILQIGLMVVCDWGGYAVLDKIIFPSLYRLFRNLCLSKCKTTCDTS